LCLGLYSPPGEGGERTRVLSRLDAVLAVTADRIRWSALYDLWTSVYSYATILMPSLLTAPRWGWMDASLGRQNTCRAGSYKRMAGLGGAWEAKQGLRGFRWVGRCASA
jgi:ABC-type uncharacterized transport system fused permease/ATPase subunit